MFSINVMNSEASFDLYPTLNLVCSKDWGTRVSKIDPDIKQKSFQFLSVLSSISSQHSRNLITAEFPTRLRIHICTYFKDHGTLKCSIMLNYSSWMILCKTSTMLHWKYTYIISEKLILKSWIFYFVSNSNERGQFAKKKNIALFEKIMMSPWLWCFRSGEFTNVDVESASPFQG